MKSDRNNDEQRKLNRDIHRNAVNERFPESSMSKDQRKDAEKLKQSQPASGDEPGREAAESSPADGI